MKDLRDKVAVVTGGANGIGLALVRSFVAEGIRVVIADVDPAALESVEKELGDVPNVLIHATDVTSAASVGALADAVYEQFGACHLLCNSAGVGAPSAKVWQTTANDWAWVFGVNVTGVVNGILSFVPRMIDSGEEGHVVNTSSGDGPIAPMPSASVYTSSKAAVSVLTECLAPNWPRTASRSASRSSIPPGDYCAPVCGRPTAPARPSWPTSVHARPSR